MANTQIADKTDYLTLLRNEFPQPAEQSIDMMPIIWRIAEALTTFGGIAVTYQYARRECQNGILSGRYEGILKWTSADVSEDNTGSFAALDALKDATQTEIDRLEQLARHARGIGVVSVTSSPLRRGGGSEFG